MLAVISTHQAPKLKQNTNSLQFKSNPEFRGRTGDVINLQTTFPGVGWLPESRSASVGECLGGHSK